MQVELTTRTFVHSVPGASPIFTVGMFGSVLKFSPTTMMSVSASSFPIGGLTPCTARGGSSTV